MNTYIIEKQRFSQSVEREFMSQDTEEWTRIFLLEQALFFYRPYGNAGFSRFPGFRGPLPAPLPNGNCFAALTIGARLYFQKGLQRGAIFSAASLRPIVGGRRRPAGKDGPRAERRASTGKRVTHRKVCRISRTINGRAKKSIVRKYQSKKINKKKRRGDSVRDIDCLEGTLLRFQKRYFRSKVTVGAIREEGAVAAGQKKRKLNGLLQKHALLVQKVQLKLTLIRFVRRDSEKRRVDSMGRRRYGKNVGLIPEYCYHHKGTFGFVVHVKMEFLAKTHVYPSLRVKTVS